MHFIIGTAGHVDHGKTTLIRALTGIETDRLREEKERGLSIVPGYAYLHLPGRTAGIVDVPGHERFLKNMLSGVSGVDIVMLVVAADEGVMPQTVEHLRILELLHIRRGILVLSKCDAVDAEWLALARDDVRNRLRGTLMERAPLVEVSATTGAGLDELKTQLARACDELEAEGAGAAVRPFRLAIDRSFSISGFGTVVTGSAAAGEVTVGQSIEVWPPGIEHPLQARVRGVEVHGEAAERAARGQRAALNLAGVDLNEAARGGSVALPGFLRPTRLVDVWLQVLDDAPRPLKDGASLRLHLGTGEVGVKAALYEGARLEAGQSGYARLRLENGLAGARGDRFILREVATERVAGGGLILEVNAPRSRKAARAGLPLLRAALEAGDDAEVAEILLRRRGTAGLNDAELKVELCRLDVDEVLQALRAGQALWSGAGLHLHDEVAHSLQKSIIAALGDWHAREPLQAVMPREGLRAALPKDLAAPVFDALLAHMAAQVVVSGAGVRLASHNVSLGEEAARLRDRLENVTYEAAWQPLTLDELVARCDDKTLARKLCFAMLKSGAFERVEDFVLPSRRVEEGAAILRAHLEEHGSLSVGQARELLNSTRKWIVPLLEFYDRSGLTRREGEVRVLRRAAG